MRKLIMLALVLASQITLAQFEDEKWLLGGNVYYNTVSQNVTGNFPSKSSSSSTRLWVRSDFLI